MSAAAAAQHHPTITDPGFLQTRKVGSLTSPINEPASITLVFKTHHLSAPIMTSSNPVSMDVAAAATTTTTGSDPAPAVESSSSKSQASSPFDKEGRPGQGAPINAESAIAGPSYRRESIEISGTEETQSSTNHSDDSSSFASPVASTPRAASPSHNASDRQNVTPTSERVNGKARAMAAIEPPSASPVPASMASLALSVQSAVSRNVTSPLVQVLSDAEQINEHHGLPTRSQELTDSSRSPTISQGCFTPQVSNSSSGSSKYTSVETSPHLTGVPDEQIPTSGEAFTALNDLSAVDQRLSNHDSDLIEAGVSMADAVPSHQAGAVEQGIAIEKRDSSSGTESTSNQTEISRTPSTSTTGSSHASSLDTAISSVPSGSSLDAQSQKLLNEDKQLPDLPAEGLRISVEDHSIASGQISPASVISDSDAIFSDLSSVTETGSIDAHSAEAKFNIAKVRRYAALLELIDTERNYADDLATLVLVFFDNLCMMPFFNDQPARQALVMRNSEDLLRIHQKISAKLEGILVDLGLRKAGQLGGQDDKRSEMEKALSPQADEAVVRVAKLFNQMMPSLESYKAFCSRHGEALALIREAEKRHADWDAYERHCADILKLTRSAHKASSRPASGATTPSHFGNSPASYFTPIMPSTAPSISGFSSTTSSASVTPGSVHGTIRQGSSRLLFRDFLIKPIQRLCLYPLVLQTLQKHNLAIGAPSDDLSLAISLMREVADQVDEAGKRRESELRADLILSRIEPNQGVTTSFLKSLGDCQLSGTLDVLHHHRVLDPLTAPLRLKYFGVFLYHSFLLMVKVRKNANYECRHWFPLWAARLSNMEEGNNLIPNSFRLSIKDHHFELAASNPKERQLWVDMLSLAISRATFSPPGSEAAFPSSLFLGDVMDFDAHEASEAPTPNASRPAEMASYFDAHKDPIVDPLMEFLAMHAAGSTQNTTTHQKSQRANTVSWMPTEILLRHASPNSRNIVDRGMVLSDSVISARILKETGALSTLYAASGSGIGSAVGSSLGLSRLAAKDTSTVKIQRRKSCAGLLENATIEDDPNSLVFTATLVQPASRSRSNTKTQLEANVDRDTWKSTLMRKAARVRPASIFTPNGLTLNTDLSSPTWGPGTSSTPTSPTTTTRDLPTNEFGSIVFTGTVANSPKRRVSVGADGLPFSSTSSPASGPTSAASSSANAKAMSARQKAHLSGMKDSLSAPFSRKGRTRSSQIDVVDFPAELGLASALSSATPSAASSPIASNVSLPHGSTMDNDQHRPSVDELILHRPVRSRTSSISSVTGSIRRALTSASLGHRKSHNDVGKVFMTSAQHERQMPIVMAGGPLVAEPISLDEGPDNNDLARASSIATDEASLRKIGRAGSLRRSKTMLHHPRTWFRASTPSTGLEKVHAEVRATAPPPALRQQRSFARPATAAGSFSGGSTQPPKPFRSSTSPEMHAVPSKESDSHRSASDTQLATMKGQQRSGSETLARKGSRMLSNLRFLQNNRMSALPLNSVAETSVEHSATSVVTPSFEPPSGRRPFPRKS